MMWMLIDLLSFREVKDFFQGWEVYHNETSIFDIILALIVLYIRYISFKYLLKAENLKMNLQPTLILL